MLDRARASVGALVDPDDGAGLGWEPLALTQTTPQFAEALSAFRMRRSLPDMRLAGHPLRIATSAPADTPEIASPWCATLRIERTSAELIVPHALLDLICRDADPSIAVTSLRLDHAALLLEFALSKAIETLEAALGWSISLSSVAKGAGQRDMAREAFVPVSLQVQGVGKFGCMLRLEPPYLLALSRYLDQISGMPQRQFELPVPVHLRWATAELTWCELRRLAPGDIILTDQACAQAGTAIAVLGEHLVAQVELLRSGYRFVGKPRLARGTGLQWTLDRDLDTGHAQEGGRREVPVRLFFQLGQLEADTSTIRELGPGSMMPLARPLEDGLDIVANGKVIGRGQITTVGDATGIRVVRI
jgi:type III secretion protein Q